MQNIVKLEKSVAQLIAAGEVVERPASVVKELVENSIDSGATSITIEIRRGGTGMIRISDNGSGISKADVPTAFLRHATSKLRDENDLNNIATLGFRGEALPSICSVAKVTLDTRTEKENVGTKIIIEGGDTVSIADSGHNIGTTITVKDLFYNTPARMKFLKSDTTESNAIAACIDRLALSHVEISFKFIRDGKRVLFTPGDNQLRSAAYTIFGKDFANALVPVDYSDDKVAVKGLVSTSENARSSRSMQYFFVNDRFVKTGTGQVALEEAYKNEIMQRKFPACILFVYLPNDMVDVNTHPAKIEVRFTDERSVYNGIYFAVKNVLNKLAPPPSIDLGTEIEKTLLKNDSMKNESAGQLRIDSKQFREIVSQKPNESLDSIALTDVINGITKNKESGSIVFSQKASQKTVEIPKMNAVAPTKTVEPKKETVADKPKEEIANYFDDVNFVGEVFGTYIVAEHDDVVLLIDKHAAHERIIFEKLKARKNASNSQVLIEPVSVTLPKDEYSLMLENSLELAEMGIMVDDFGMGTLLVREFPVEMSDTDIVSVIEEISSNMKKGKKDISPAVLDELYHSIACKAAIKGNRRSSDDELKALIRMLWENGEVKHCPHGRPVAVILGKKEIEKRFGRT